MAGRYTREGDVRPLLRATDDMFVISRPGDEIALSFDARSLPPLPAGWTRTFLLYVHGYSKEMNPRSASPDTVAPLPFRGMTRYPYAAGEHYPRTTAHREYLERYNTRIVTRPIPLIGRSIASRRGGGTMTPMIIRYAAAACQTDLANPLDRAQMRENTDRMLSMIDAAVAGSAPFLPVRLVVFPEFAHAAPVYPTVRELLDKLAVPIPNEHTDRLERKAREHGIYIQSGSMLEVDPRWPARRLQHHVPDRTGRAALQVPEGESVDPVRGALEPARPRGLRRSALSGRRHADRPHRLRDLLRLAVSRGDPPARRQRRRGARARVGVHGPVGRDRADELVDDRQPLPRAREHGVRRRREPGREPAALPAVLVARRQPDRRLRRTHARRGLTRSRASASSSRRSTSPRSATSARRGAGTACSRTCGPRPIPSTRVTSTRRSGAQREPSYERNVELIEEAKCRRSVAGTKDQELQLRVSWNGTPDSGSCSSSRPRSHRLGN